MRATPICAQCVGSIISDCAALGVAKALGYIPSKCMMHYLDKLSQSALGFLLRRRGGAPVNPFPEGVALFNYALSLAKHFSYGGKAEILKNIARNMIPVRDRTVPLRVARHAARSSPRRACRAPLAACASPAPSSRPWCSLAVTRSPSRRSRSRCR